MSIITIENLKTSDFENFINSSNIDEIQMIEIDNKSFVCKAFPPATKSFIKFVKFEFDENVKTNLGDGIRIKLPIYRFDRIKTIISILNLSNIENINLNINTSEENEQFLIGKSIKFVSQDINIEVKAADIMMISYMDDSIIKKYLDLKDPIIKIDLNKQFINKLSKFIDIEKDELSISSEKNPNIILHIKNGEVIFRSKEKNRWSLKYNKLTDGNLLTSFTGELKTYLNKNMITRMNGLSQEVYIMKKTEEFYTIVSLVSENNAFISSLVLVEEEQPKKK